MACSSDEISKMEDSEEAIPQLVPITECAPMLPGTEDGNDKTVEETCVCPIESKNLFAAESENQETCVGKLDTVERKAGTQQECQEELEIFHEIKHEELDPSKDDEKEANGHPPKKKRRLGMRSVIKKDVPQCDLIAELPADLETTRIEQQTSEEEPRYRVETGDGVPDGSSSVSGVNNSCEHQFKDISCPEETKPDTTVEMGEEMTGSPEQGCSSALYNNPSDIGEAEKIHDSEAVAVQPQLDTVEQTSRMQADGAHVDPNIPEPPNLENPDEEPGCGLAMNTDHLQKDTNDPFGPEGDHYVSDSQLNEAWMENEMMCDESSDSSDCIEDGSDLVCGLVQELSCLNFALHSLNIFAQIFCFAKLKEKKQPIRNDVFSRTVMAADRELGNLLRSRISRNSKRK